jgi:hypothetical protein
LVSELTVKSDMIPVSLDLTAPYYTCLSYLPWIISNLN